MMLLVMGPKFQDIPELPRVGAVSSGPADLVGLKDPRCQRVHFLPGTALTAGLLCPVDRLN